MLGPPTPSEAKCSILSAQTCVESYVSFRTTVNCWFYLEIFRARSPHWGLRLPLWQDQNLSIWSLQSMWSPNCRFIVYLMLFHGKSYAWACNPGYSSHSLPCQEPCILLCRSQEFWSPICWRIQFSLVPPENALGFPGLYGTLVFKRHGSHPPFWLEQNTWIRTSCIRIQFNLEPFLDMLDPAALTGFWDFYCGRASMIFYMARYAVWSL